MLCWFSNNGGKSLIVNIKLIKLDSVVENIFYSQMIEDKSRLMKYCAFLNSAILELFLFSYSGQQLIIEVSLCNILLMYCNGTALMTPAGFRICLVDGHAATHFSQGKRNCRKSHN